MEICKEAQALDKLLGVVETTSHINEETALRYWKANAALLALLFLSSAVRAQELERQGELRIYPRETQIGTVALRELRTKKEALSKLSFTRNLIYPRDPSVKSYCANNLSGRLLTTNTTVISRPKATNRL